MGSGLTLASMVSSAPNFSRQVLEIMNLRGKKRGRRVTTVGDVRLEGVVWVPLDRVEAWVP